MPARAPLSILVVDDGQVGRMALARAFGVLGHEAAALGDHATALAWLATHHADLVILDWPDTRAGAPDLLRRIREREARDDIPYTFVAVVVPADPEAEPAIVIEEGADAWLRAPLDASSPSAIVALARRTLDLRRALRAQREQLAVSDERLREETRRDPVTRLGNRVRLDEDLRRIRGGAERYGHRWTAVMLDIDQGRRLTESIGHAAMDDVLREVSRVIRRTMRDGDAAYRFGDDTFLLLLPEQSEDGGVSVAERARAAVAELAIPHPRSDVSTHVTLSAGVAVLHGAADDATEDWLRRVNGALYAAKAAGRDGVARDGETHVVGWGQS